MNIWQGGSRTSRPADSTGRLDPSELEAASGRLRVPRRRSGPGAVRAARIRGRPRGPRRARRYGFRARPEGKAGKGPGRAPEPVRPPVPAETQYRLRRRPPAHGIRRALRQEALRHEESVGVEGGRRAAPGRRRVLPGERRPAGPPRMARVPPHQGPGLPGAGDRVLRRAEAGRGPAQFPGPADAGRQAPARQSRGPGYFRERFHPVPDEFRTPIPSGRDLFCSPALRMWKRNGPGSRPPPVRSSSSAIPNNPSTASGGPTSTSTISSKTGSRPPEERRSP
jgi:hypothetical protein